MKHFYHYLLTVFLAGQVPGWGQNATEGVDYRNPFDLDPDQRTQKFDDSGTIGWLIEIHIFIQSKTNRCDV